MSEKKKGKEILLGAAAGAVIGVVTGLLFAPKPGRELRQDVSKVYGQLQNAAQNTVAEISEKSQALKKQAVTAVGKWRSKSSGTEERERTEEREQTSAAE